MTDFLHAKLPDHSALLSGRSPRNEDGFQSSQLQILYRNTDEGWRDPAPHMHRDSDECFIVLKGSVMMDVEGQVFTIGPREYCCIPRGVYHSLLGSDPPVEALIIRAPSIEDKVYRDNFAHTPDFLR